MVNTTLDAIVRRTLAKHKLPIHYYVPFLLHAREGAENNHFDVIGELKYVVLAVNDGYMADLPADCVEVVYVGLENGDKVKPIGYKNTLNKKLNQSLGVDVPFDEAEDSNWWLGSLEGSFALQNYYTTEGEFRGRLFGQGAQYSDAYTILRGEGKIRLDQKSDITNLHVAYVALPEKVNNQSLVHPYSAQAVSDYIIWQWAIFNPSNRFDPVQKERLFNNSRRKLTARGNKMTATELKRILRKGFVLSPKN